MTIKTTIVLAVLGIPLSNAPCAAQDLSAKWEELTASDFVRALDASAGTEIANVMASRPDLAHPERAPTESGADRARLDLPEGVYTGIWWYASFPNHYQGDAAGATAAPGAAATRTAAARIATAIRAIKQDQVGPALQREFFERAAHPSGSEQPDPGR